MTKREIVRKMTDVELCDLYYKHKSISNILKVIESQDTGVREILSERLTQNGILLCRRSMRYSINDLKSAIANSICMADVLKQLNLTYHNNNIKNVKLKIKEHNLSLEHFDLKKSYRRGKKEWTRELIFCKNSEYDRSSISRAVKKFKILDMNICSSCHLTNWLGNDITLDVDHINGDHRNNEISNLRMLCPNCHSQTSTYKTRKK